MEKRAETQQAIKNLAACRGGNREAGLEVINFIEHGVGSLQDITCSQDEYTLIIKSCRPAPSI